MKKFFDWLLWWDSGVCFYNAKERRCVPHQQHIFTGVYREKDTFSGVTIIQL